VGFSRNHHRIGDGVIESGNLFGAGAGGLAAAIVMFETAHSLMVYAYVAPTAAVLREYQVRQNEVIDDLNANRNDQLNADIEALNRSALKLQMLGRVGEALVAH
jgi:hypothetical protein